MAWSRKTWLWIVAGVVGFGLLCVIALAAFAFYFVRNNVHTVQMTLTEANKVFDDTLAKFRDNDKPVFDLDNPDQPRQLRNLAEMPTSPIKTEKLWILAWDPDKNRVVRVSLPFWLLRFGRQRVDIRSGGFDLERLQLDLKDLRRVGPVIVVDHRTQGGERVLVWTE